MTTDDPSDGSSPYPQPWEVGQRPWKPWLVEDSEATWRSLGAVVHGPVLLAKVPGIAIGLRCLFAHPDRLTAWLVARADAAFIPQVLPPRSDAEAAVQSALWEHWPGPPNDPLVHAFVDHVPQRLFLGERNDGYRGHDVLRLSCAVRIFGLPTDDELGLEVSWGPALAPTTTTLDLPDLRRIAASAVSFVDDGPVPPAI
ncbi:hypothetical protein [Kineococcus aurantiacus]|uniref:Uncharacterized protein n=1 Tax=Kineococcus aurantiacus TaxID=37633 RepID=A0A7Y9DL45_9ACTN|nr:hypothetical protein [Kineococcus aurantiacus]NYD22608.1 hypothetical protein [Kineococcus aurantiacus]